MPRIKFTAETMPKSSEEFHRALDEAWAKDSLLSDLVEIVRDLVIMEQRYGMNSTEFYKQFQEGQLGDDLDYIDWATRYEIYLQIRDEIKETLKRAEHIPHLVAV